jgi:hypothetical protein
MILTEKDDRQAPSCIRSIASDWARHAFVSERGFFIIPSPQMPMEAKLGLLGKVREDRFDSDWRAGAIFIEVFAAMKVVLIYDGTPIDALWPKDKIERLAHSGFADIVAADQ